MYKLAASTWKRYFKYFIDIVTSDYCLDKDTNGKKRDGYVQWYHEGNKEGSRAISDRFEPLRDPRKRKIDLDHSGTRYGRMQTLLLLARLIQWPAEQQVTGKNSEDTKNQSMRKITIKDGMNSPRFYPIRKGAAVKCQMRKSSKATPLNLRESSRIIQQQLKLL